MTLHPAVVSDLLDGEMQVAQERLGGRISSLSRTGTSVYCTFTSPGGGNVTMRLEGGEYDAEPLRFAVVTSDDEVLPLEAWPPGLGHSIHPVLGRPFACVQGTYEYHCLPCHMEDAWDAYRGRLRMTDLLDHLLRRAGA